MQKTDLSKPQLAAVLALFSRLEERGFFIDRSLLGRNRIPSPEFSGSGFLVYLNPDSIDPAAGPLFLVELIHESTFLEHLDRQFPALTLERAESIALKLARIAASDPLIEAVTTAAADL